MSRSPRDEKLAAEQSKRAGILVGVGVGAAVAAAFPPAAVVLGFVGFLRGARRFAQNPTSTDAGTDLLLGYSDVANAGRGSNSGSNNS